MPCIQRIPDRTKPIPRIIKHPIFSYEPYNSQKSWLGLLFALITRRSSGSIWGVRAWEGRTTRHSNPIARKYTGHRFMIEDGTKRIIVYFNLLLMIQVPNKVHQVKGKQSKTHPWKHPEKHRGDIPKTTEHTVSLHSVIWLYTRCPSLQIDAWSYGSGLLRSM